MATTDPPHSREGNLWDAATDSIQTGLPTFAAKKDTHASCPDSYDIIVIGAGFAGLTASRDLSLQGKNVLLLEARDRIGGRTWVAQGKHASYEMGGTWVHPLQTRVCEELRRYGIEKLKESFQFEHLEDGFEAAMMESVNDLLPLISRFFDVDGHGGAEVSEAMQSSAEVLQKWDITIQERIEQMDLSEEEGLALGEWFEEVSYAPASKVSFLSVLQPHALCGSDYRTFMETMAKFKIEGGTTALADGMFKDFVEAGGVALFDRVVSSIHTETDRALVKLAGNRGEVFTADKIICTVPVNCLGDVEFHPSPRVPLDKLKHLHRGGKMHMHTTERPREIVTELTDPRDEESVLGMFAESSSQSGGCNCAVFFADKNYSSRYPITEGARGHVDAMVARLKLSGLDVTDMTWHDWRHDPFSKGVWSIWGVGMASGVLGEIMADRWVSERVLLAGGDIARGWAGYIEGAIEEGREAASVVMMSNH